MSEYARVGVPALPSMYSLSVFSSSESASRLAALGYYQDMQFCAQVDLWNVVPVLVGGAFVPYSGACP